MGGCRKYEKKYFPQFFRHIEIIVMALYPLNTVYKRHNRIRVVKLTIIKNNIYLFTREIRLPSRPFAT